MEELLRIKTLAQFRAVVSSGTGLVITDPASKRVFHPAPADCPHIQERSFKSKVITNRERNGSYYAVASMREARERWPEIKACPSSACSSASDVEADRNRPAD